MIPSNRSRCAEYIRTAARQVEAGAGADAAESLRVAVLLMWDPPRVSPGDKLLTATSSSRERWLEERVS